MNLIKQPLLLGFIFSFFVSHECFSQKDWTLKTEKNGIKVYTKSFENSPFKAIKTVCTIDASLTKTTAVLLDIKNTGDWVYSTKSAVVLNQISPTELIYYSEINVPWPASNRDFIVRLKVTQDAKTKAVTLLADNLPNHLPTYKNIVRIPQSYSKWVIEPVNANQVKVEYVLQVDPGGSVPAWLINMFATRGPLESFVGLRSQVKKEKYHNVSLPFIRD